MENLLTSQTLPGLPIIGICPLPNNDIAYDFTNVALSEIITQAETSFGSNLVLLIPRNTGKDDIAEFEDVGILANIILDVKGQKGSMKLKLRLISRVTVQKVFYSDTILMTESIPFKSICEMDTELQTMMGILNKNAQTHARMFSNPQFVFNILQNETDYEKAVDITAHSIITSKPMDKLKYLTEPDIKKRIESLLSDMQFLEYAQSLEEKLNNKVKESIEKSQKEYYLREKMKAIQEELGDKANRDQMIESLRSKIQSVGMPEATQKRALEELKRYEQMNPNNVETNIIEHYLNFLVELPWKTQSEDNEDLNYAIDILNKNHYGLDKVKQRIIEYLGVKIMTKKNPKTILCLYGPPGVGKTSLAISIAEALNRKFVRQSLGGMKDDSEIKGHRRTYVGALPGRILTGMKNAGTINPVFLLDEIDKMASSYKGDPASAMLEVLDPEQNSNFSDYFLEEPYDLSQVLFITTANYIDGIPAPLRDRMEMIEVSSYTEQEKFMIAKNYLIERNAKEYGVKYEDLSISDGAIKKIIEEYTREAGVRELSRTIGSLVRKLIMESIKDHKPIQKVDEDNLHEFLGKAIFTRELADKKDQIGVVTGLAYTTVGGDTLSIEVTHYKGKGNLILTGKLGDVMKESAMAALSYVKANAKKYDIDESIFDTTDIHIHVPEGAVPKDGPSAGVTITTAIVSSLTNRYVKKEVGMTGEVTLRGIVLPIGGLKEKSIAAHRSGLKTILIPKENIRDLEDIPEEVKSTLEIIPVETVDEVISYALR